MAPKLTTITKLLIVCTILLAGATTFVELASAQETTTISTATPTANSSTSSTPTRTATSTATPTDTPTPEPDNTTVVQTIGPTVRILDVTYNDRTNTFGLIVEADVPVLLTITEGITINGEGTQSGDIDFRRKTLDPGENSVSVSAERNSRGTAFVILTANGNSAYIADSESGSLITGPWSGADARNSAIGAAIGVAAMVLIGAVRAKVGGREDWERMT